MRDVDQKIPEKVGETLPRLISVPRTFLFSLERKETSPERKEIMVSTKLNDIVWLLPGWEELHR